MRGIDALSAIAEVALTKARGAGAEAAEVYLIEGRTRAVKAIGNFVETKEGNDEGIGIRVAVDGHLGHSGMSGLSGENIEAVVQNAIESVRGTGSLGTFHAFAQAHSNGARAAGPHPALVDVDPDRLTGILDDILDQLRATQEITYYGIKVANGHSRFLVANTNDLVGWNESANESVEISVRATRGLVERTAQTTWSGAGPIGPSLPLGPFVDAVVANARDALDARVLDRPVDNVILVPQAAAQIIGLAGAAFSGRRVLQGQSPLAGRLGEKIAHHSFTFRDEPRGPSGSARMHIDHEGVMTENIDLVEGGVLTDLAYDTASAGEEGRVSNGHGLRASLGGAVLPRLINPMVANGDMAIEEMIEGCGRAILITDRLMGMIGSNNTTGDFSLVAPYAFLIEGGERKHALPPTTVGGNVYEVLKDLRGLSRETKSVPGGTYPTIHTGGIACAT